MESNKTDLRVQKTQHQIKEALLELLEEQPFDSITVSRISERAMISRSTFYDHYPDKYTLLEHMYDEIEEQLIAITDAYFSEKGSDYRMELAGKILRYVLDNARLFRILFAKAASAWERDACGRYSALCCRRLCRAFFPA